MKALLAINSLETGGAETFFCHLARGLAEAGHTVYCWQLFYSVQNPAYEKILDHPNIIAFTPPIGDVKLLVQKPSLLKKWWVKNRLSRFIKQHEIQLINTHLFETDCFSVHYINLPHVVSMHGSYEMYLDKPEIFARDCIFRDYPINRLMDRVFSKTDYVITAAKKNEIAFSKASKIPANGRVYYGRPVSHKLNDSTEIKRIGMLARGLESKGWRNLLMAYSALLLEFPELKVLLGYTPSAYMEELKSEFLHLDGIEWREQVTDPIEFFSAIDLFVFPTQYPAESLPNVVIESLACQVPVLATDIGEIETMLSSDEGMAGHCLPHTLDSNALIEALVVQLRNWLVNPSQYMNVKRCCKPAFTKFDLALSASNYERIFNEVIKRHG